MSLQASWSFLLHPAMAAVASVGCHVSRMQPIALGRAVAGTSSALESTFPVVKAQTDDVHQKHLATQIPASTPFLRLCDFHGSHAFLRLQSGGELNWAD